MKKSIVKLTPYFESAIWGGDLLYEEFSKGEKNFKVAESWELSNQIEKECVLKSTEKVEYRFSQYLEYIGKNCLGKNIRKVERFPLLIKFIGAADKLSVQVHPKKNEIWYIVNAAKDAYVYVGFKRNMKKDLNEKLVNGEILDYLNKIPVFRGQIICVPSGVVHAIGEGIVICEIQDNSDCTYRLFDYERKDCNGKLRKLDIEKGIKKLILYKQHIVYMKKRRQVIFNTFKVVECCVNKQLEYNYSQLSFVVVIVIEGAGKIYKESMKMQENLFIKGDTFFIPAEKNGILHVNGKGTLVIIEIKNMNRVKGIFKDIFGKAYLKIYGD